jgi:signal transduction histidine kinase
MDTAQLASRGSTPSDDDYAASVSHELRTAIAIILGYTEILQSLEAGPLTDTQRTMLEKIDGNACHLLAMTQKILDC